MAERITKLQVFVASPSDVKQERERLAIVVEELNRDMASRIGIVLELVQWQTHAWPGIGEDSQDVINREIGPFDVFIGIMWKRFGQLTKRAQSGTVEEFERAYRLWATRRKPQILFYFNRRPFYPNSKRELAEIQKVTTFQNTLRDRGVLFGEYNGTKDFENKVRAHLARVISEWGQSQAKPDIEEIQDGDEIETPQASRVAGNSLNIQPSHLTDPTAILREANAVLQQGTPLALLVIDLDGFKRINDTVGHLEGDRYMQGITDVMRKVTSGKGQLHRYAGDEFVALLINSSQGEAVATAERIRSTVEAQEPCGEVKVTASIGVAGAEGAVESVGDLLKSAHIAAFVSKLRGKNCVTTAPLSADHEQLFRSARARQLTRSFS